MTLPQLAEKAGMSKGNLSKIETGKGNPTLTTLENIAKALGISVEALL